MILNLVYLILGIGLTVGGAEWLVGGAGKLARKFGVSTLIVGLTIVAFGTSAPELVINVVAALSGETDLALGNILGSNVANLGLIAGLAALMVPVIIESNVIRREIPFMFLTAAVLLGLSLDGVLDGATIGTLTRADGIVLLLFFAAFIYYLFLTISLPNGKGSRGIGDAMLTSATTFETWKSLLFIAGGVIGLFAGGWLTVTTATSIATALGISQLLIGATLIALGTSLPELVTMIVAVRRGHDDLALGNLIGSNIANVALILGITSLIAPIPVPTVALVDIVLVVTLSALFYVLAATGKTLTRAEGVLLLLLYGGYVVYVLFR